jgi:hypothetical protein
MTMEPQLEGVQDAAVTGTDGIEALDVDDIDMPPPQALNAAVSKAHATAGSQRRGLMHA